MERALNLNLLRAALGAGGMFPSPEEVQRRLAEAEIALFCSAAPSTTSC